MTKSVKLSLHTKIDVHIKVKRLKVNILRTNTRAILRLILQKTSYIKLIHACRTHPAVTLNITLTHTIKSQPYLPILVISLRVLQSLELPPLE